MFVLTALKFKKISYIFIYISALSCIFAQNAIALSTTEVEKIAQSISVQIKGQGSGSGVIIKHDGQTYTVLTAGHVVANNEHYEITTQDRQKHTVINGTIKRFPGLDLAILQFASPQKYRVAKLGYYPATILEKNSGYRTGTPNIYVFGWPASSEIVQNSNGFLSSGQIDMLSTNLGDGYSMGYNNPSWPGMSGGPVLDTEARVVGIHGRALGFNFPDTEANTVLKVPFSDNLGISIQSFLNSVKNVSPALKFSAVRLQPNLSIIQPPLESSIPEMKYPQTSTGKAIELYNQAIYLSKDNEKTLTLFDRALQIKPDFYPAWIMKSKILGALNRPQEALSSINQGLKHEPNSWYGQMAYYIALRRLNSSSQEILAALDKASESNDYGISFHHANSLAEKALYLGDLKQYDLADLAFEQALKIAPNSSDILDKKAHYLLASKRFQEALAVNDQAIKLDPDSASNWILKGILLSSLGRNNEALDSYAKVLKIGASNDILSRMYNTRAGTFENLKQYENSISDYEKYLQLAPPDRPRFLAFLRVAQMQSQLEQNYQALDSFEKALTSFQNVRREKQVLKDNDLIPYLCLMGRSYIFNSMGRYQDALREVEPVLKFNLPQEQRERSREWFGILQKRSQG
jgi:tetratricopeptide (TPR) repeat protein